MDGLLKSDFTEIYFLGSDLRRYEKCLFGLFNNNKRNILFAIKN